MMPPRTPTLIQLLGLAFTLGAVAVFSLFTLSQLSGLKRLGSDIVDRNRRDSLQLIRIQNDLAQIGLALRDMVEGTEPYPISGYRAEFERIKGDLEDALAVESGLTPASRTPAQQVLLRGAFERFWSAAGQLWEMDERGAKTLIRTRLEAERSTMTTVISRMLVQNNEAEAAAVQEIQGIYGKVERNLYVFVGLVLAAIALTGMLVIAHDRRMFNSVAELSEQRRQLAGQVISGQEDVFRTLARELHDEFGQVLTALGVMLQRVERKLAESSEERAGVHEVREIANQTLERVRGMSQMLHPPVLDDYGLEKSIEWYLEHFRKQTGLEVHYEKIGVGPWIGDRIAIHVYRILQEALNNVVRHARTSEVWVKAAYSSGRLVLEVRDRGAGLPARPAREGIGLIAMRERAELLGGEIVIESAADGGTRVLLSVPLGQGVDS
ncbi:MAG: sensor histidine kinase [Acidobacteria bacterium]|nr:sensor histidine kinase [Acidobacteriota bacterium]